MSFMSRLRLGRKLERDGADELLTPTSCTDSMRQVPSLSSIK
jgi:hypothetical protein